MTTQSKIYISLFAIILPLFAIAQVNRVQTTPGYWTFGLNGGFSYQSSDIRATDQGFGFGATLGKSIYYEPGAPISLELRGRFLYARQYGLDPFRSYDIGNNDVLNGSTGLDYTTYPSQLNEPRGFVYQNHKTDVGELALEGVLTLNRLRETTGVVASIYGGLGIDWYRTKMDQADGIGNEYFAGYAGLSESATKSNIRGELRSQILDGNFESLADEFEDFGKLGIMPSVGFEIGYDLTPNFSIFGGHRITFSGTDLLDGHQWENPNKDIYHYTNFGLRWKIQPQRSVALLPEIDINRPYSNPYRTKSRGDGRVTADIRNVRSQVDINVAMNGREVPFNYRNGSLTTQNPLQPGRNEIRISARNSAGTTNEMMVIIFEEDALGVPPPPVTNARPQVTITNPPYSEYRANTPNFRVTGVITGVKSRDDISFFLDNKPYRNFDFNLSNGSFTANVPLIEGRNTIRLNARNQTGRSEESSLIIREIVAQPPSVQIRQPANDYSETEQERISLLANVIQVQNRNQVRVSVNGRNLSNFRFSENRGQIEADITLQTGNNTIEVSVQTPDGSSSDQVSVVKRNPQPVNPAPVVSIYNPSSRDSRTYDNQTRIEARVDYVNRKNDITFEVNGIRNNNFSFNNNNGQLSANVSLREGNNNIRITAYNSSGSNGDEVNIFKEREIITTNPPRVRINAPRNNTETDRPNIDIRATTQGVNRKSDITFYLNNQRIRNFNFSTFNGQIDANVPLSRGNNIVRIIVQNTDGQDEQQVSVFYRQSAPPVVRIRNPRNGTQSQTNMILVQASVQNINRSNQIEFLVNGRRISRFDFSGARGDVTANVNLQPGNNTIRILARNADGQAEDQVNVSFDDLPLPIVRISKPANNTRTDQQGIRLVANVQHVRSQNDIEVRVNGQAIRNFQYNSNNNQLTADVQLRPGNNSLQVRAVNRKGNDNANVSVTYEPLQAPTVAITDPSGANTQSTSKQYNLRARTTGVEQKSSITVTINGRPVTRFTWDSRTGNLSLPLTLVEGDNQIQIQVRNAAGTDQARTVIKYTEPKLPEVNITSPGNNSSSNESKIQVKAKIKNVASKRNIIFKVNGQVITNFTMRGENFLANAVSLRKGSNTISISASNPDGTKADEVTIRYRPVLITRPTVKITSVSNPVVDFRRPEYGVVSMVASIKNVKDASQVKLLIDGKSSDQFTFNPTNGNFEANLVLKKGEPHTVVVEATNQGGTGRDSKNISF